MCGNGAMVVVDLSSYFCITVLLRLFRHHRLVVTGYVVVVGLLVFSCNLFGYKVLAAIFGIT